MIRPQARGDLVAAGKLNAEADGIEADLEAAVRCSGKPAAAPCVPCWRISAFMTLDLGGRDDLP